MRIYDQAVETVKRTDTKPGDLIVPFHYRKITKWNMSNSHNKTRRSENYDMCNRGA